MFFQTNLKQFLVSPWKFFAFMMIPSEPYFTASERSWEEILSHPESLLLIRETRRGSPVDCRPSTAEAPPIGKIQLFNEMAVFFEPVIRF